MFQSSAVTLSSHIPQPSRLAGGNRMGSGAKVLILCVNRLLRESIARILAKRTDFEIAAQAEPCPSFEHIRDSGADVLVLDSLDFLLDNFASSSVAGKPTRSVTDVHYAVTV